MRHTVPALRALRESGKLGASRGEARADSDCGGPLSPLHALADAAEPLYVARL
jgi:hypothetical protein